MGAFTLRVDTAQLIARLGEVSAGAELAARPAAQAAAQVFYDAARANVGRSAKGHWFHGTSFRATGKKYWFEAGSLQRAIYQVYSQKNSNDHGTAIYEISWNRTKAPYGHMVELGTSRAPAHPFLRPAFNNNRDRAEQAMVHVFGQRMKGVL
jgi:HK97 gp10 family phage protein